MRIALLTALLPLAALSAGAADGVIGLSGSDAVGQGEFPGLQILPPGSVVEDISLPRYEHHRVSALFQAKRLCIISRRVVELQGIRGTMYGVDGTTTEFHTESAQYDFTTKRISSAGAAEVTDPRFSARGNKLLYDSGNRRGVLLGPVRTSLSPAAFSRAQSH